MNAKLLTIVVLNTCRHVALSFQIKAQEQEQDPKSEKTYSPTGEKAGIYNERAAVPILRLVTLSNYSVYLNVRLLT